MKQLDGGLSPFERSVDIRWSTTTCYMHLVFDLKSKCTCVVLSMIIGIDNLVTKCTCNHS